MGSSLFVAWIAKGDAASINQSGLLRMQSYKILNQLMRKELETGSTRQEAVEDSMNHFELLLNDKLLKTSFDVSSTTLKTAYHDIHRQWYSSIKPGIQQELLHGRLNWDLYNETTYFVTQINHLVTSYQKNAEKRIYLLELIQIITIASLLFLVIYALHILKKNIAHPLSALNEAALKVKNGDLNCHVDIKSNDEFGRLAEAMNAMSKSIIAVYRDLEKQIEQETAAVERNKRGLQLMFNTSHAINKNINGKFDFQPIINELSDTIGLTQVDLCLKTPEGGIAYDHLYSNEAPELSRCMQRLCEQCFKNEKKFIQQGNEYKHYYPLSIDGKDFGRIICHSKKGAPLTKWQDQILQSISGCIPTALNIRLQVEQGNRLSLLEERSVIARELHDSLAQSLSYLNIQVTRLQKAHTKGTENQIDAIIGELKQGINTTYRQLRELLTTFRLGLNETGLRESLIAMVIELRQRSEMQVELKYTLENLPLTSREEIHLMQTAREAAQNAVKHSEGSHLKISVYDESGEVFLNVRDDGTNLDLNAEKYDHFGLAIMSERSRILNGQLKIDAPDQTGTRVLFHFHPISTSAPVVRELSQ
ncbi:hypothetical protein BMR02_01025 [Methylococcaceae bacterium HT1]|nr:hypothetical protein BMR02_01025 [Methylococcaceae bacterium HT1]TXL20814.1 hypothetical protein BMR03_13980 [Methylococcaceae bacterium HT2]